MAHRVGRFAKSEINQLRHQAFVGQITFEQYKTAVLNLHGITDPDLVTRGIQKVIKEKDKIHFFNGARETLLQLKKQAFISWDSD